MIEQNIQNIFLKVEIKDYIVKIDGKNLFNQPINNGIKTYENIRKIDTGQRNDYTTGCLLDFSCFKNNYKMIAINLRSRELLMQMLEQLFFILEEAKETILEFSKKLWEYCKCVKK